MVLVASKPKAAHGRVGTVIWKILKHPVTGVVITAAVAVALFLVSRATKEPKYAASEPEELARSLAPHLTILWDKVDVPVVMSVRVAFWNRGSLYIDAKDISESDPIRLVPSKSIQILSVELVRSSRQNMAFRHAIEHDPALARPVVEIRVLHDEALEHMDGALFQILFAGDKDTDFTVTGRIKGAPQGFTRMKWANAVRPRLQSRLFKSAIVFYILSGIAVSVIGIRRLKAGRELSGWTYFSVGIIYVVTAVWGYFLLFGHLFTPTWIS